VQRNQNGGSRSIRELVKQQNSDYAMPIFKKRIKIGYKGYFLLDKEPFI
jgi:hypothetical protein